ncbi:MAG: gcp [Chlamydiales bacterium]|jgi:N6-L-threonylcarbamoyladenine synthase|nr:gcp [Chlamydiales bacterium]
MLILGIESTCDETAAAVVASGKHILSNVISSQIDLQKEYGGVVPELACRRHIDVIIPVINQALKEANLCLAQIDAIAAAKGPGLLGALLIGLNSAKALALATEKPFLGINHVEAHLYAAIMPIVDQVEFPCLGVVISGGHTAIVKINTIGEYTLIGQTVDDAIGEAFDKVAIMLGLSYPGGPNIERLAKEGFPNRYPFKPGVVKGSPFDFSFSGLKTNVLYTLKGQNSDKQAPIVLPESEKAHIAASFQHTALSDIVDKAIIAAHQTQCKSIILGGGVSNNFYLRELFATKKGKFEIYWPPTGLSLDNAAMIAGLAYHHYQKRPYGDSLDLEAMTRIPFK